MTQLLGAIASEQHSLAFYAALSAQYPFFAPFVNAQNAQLKALSSFVFNLLNSTLHLNLPRPNMLMLAY